MGFLFGRAEKRESAARTEKASEPGPETPGELLRQARNGVAAARDELIRSYTPFVMRVASQASGRYVRAGEDDEASVGLLAFNEAIDSYDSRKGASFLGFAEVVIKRRLIDHYRKEAGRREVPLTEFDQEDEEGNVENFVQSRRALEEFELRTEAIERREEILRYQETLSRFVISFADLPAISPKHEDARVRAIQAGRLVAQNPEYRSHLCKKKELPLQALEREVSVSRKTLERQRKYIIAVAIIYIEDFVYLKEYIARA